MREIGLSFSRSSSRVQAWARTLVLTAVVLVPLLQVPIEALAAETGWVRGEVRLNLRSGAGTQFKIIGTVATGDELVVLDTADSWTRVRTQDGRIGWIPAGYLETQPPPALRLEQVETEAATLRAELEKIRSETSRLRESNASLSAADSGQREKIESLQVENYELRASSRYQEWITGAMILGLGMLIGALLHRNATRRPSSRIRL
jgi:SH3 domain protein